MALLSSASGWLSKESVHPGKSFQTEHGSYVDLTSCATAT
jgi:hypothetical protein